MKQFDPLVFEDRYTFKKLAYGGFRLRIERPRLRTMLYVFLIAVAIYSLVHGSVAENPEEAIGFYIGLFFVPIFAGLCCWLIYKVQYWELRCTPSGIVRYAIWTNSW